MRELRSMLSDAVATAAVAEVPLADELAAVEKYARVQQLRFGDRLQLEWDIADDVLGAATPHFLLQPLVENGIKYSVEALSGTHTVRVAAVRESGELVVRVTDDGIGPASRTAHAERGFGRGLANARERLAYLYGTAHALTLHAATDGPGTIVEVRVPFRATDRGARYTVVHLRRGRDRMTTSTTEPASGKPFLVLSDVHLGAVPPATERAFLAFLTYAAETAAGLLLNGDIFDVWYAPRQFVPRRYVRALALLAEVIEGGLPVYFVAGNRDVASWGGRILEDDIGLRVLDDPARLRMGTRSALVAHGDGVRGRTASPYRKPAAMLRHPAVIWAARHLLPTNWFFGTLLENSGTRIWVARHARGESTGPKARASSIEAWARRELAADATLDLVICGHSHFPALVDVGGGRFYANAGDWVGHHSYLVIPDGQAAPEVRRWPSREFFDWSALDSGMDVSMGTESTAGPSSSRTVITGDLGAP